MDVYGEENQHAGQIPKRPELLLECEGEVPLVIERKAVVWPSTHQRDHSKEHQLLDDVADVVREEFSDKLYELSFRETDLEGKSQKQVREFAGQIGGLVVSNAGTAKSPGGSVDIHQFAGDFGRWRRMKLTNQIVCRGYVHASTSLHLGI